MQTRNAVGAEAQAGQPGLGSVMGAFKRQLARDIDAASGELRGLNRAQLLLVLRDRHAEWIPRLEDVGEAARVGELNDLVHSIQVNRMGLGDGALVGFAVEVWTSMARTLLGLPEADKRMREFMTALAERQRLERLLQDPVPAPAPAQVPQRQPRREQYAFGGRAMVAEGHAEARPVVRRERSAPLSSRDRYFNMLVERYRGVPEATGKCYTCHLLGAVPPGTPSHSGRECPQIELGMKKLGIAP